MRGKIKKVMTSLALAPMNVNADPQITEKSASGEVSTNVTFTAAVGTYTVEIPAELSLNAAAKPELTVILKDWNASGKTLTLTPEFVPSETAKAKGVTSPDVMVFDHGQGTSGNQLVYVDADDTDTDARRTVECHLKGDAVASLGSGWVAGNQVGIINYNASLA